MELYISRKELETALVAMNEAAVNGFTESQAIFTFAAVDKVDQPGRIVRLDDSVFTGEIILRSHPTDAAQNWGRVCDAGAHELVDGVCAFK